ncbi:universal stress protein [Trueperella pecoris]|uniref:universal stress protein n=1 Tax=Trueperella pecoris TaxID=2733571 RepID=UPI001ABE50CC|nr:universal stress protein [Trueperella pecoris]QTG76278.1 universal stress protein [Trueperella pecoris]
MPVVVPVTPGARDDALVAAIDLCQRQERPLVVLLRRPVSEFHQETVDAEIDDLTELLERVDIAFSIEVRLGEEELATHIANVVTQTKASLVVVSLAKRPVNGRLRLGSQIQKLLLESQCAVLVVPER